MKICGITCSEDARLALDLGAWAIGFIFYPPSPRYVPPETAAEILRQLPAGTIAVGVFVDGPLDGVNEAVRRIGLRGVQLHGSESPSYAAEVRSEHVIKAFRVKPGFDPARLDGYPGALILLDAYREGVPGGTGASFDWEIAREVQSRRPIFLAGGLTPDTVEAAVAAVGPVGIDVSSGVEARPGRKDPEKLRRLFEAVARCGAAGGAGNPQAAGIDTPPDHDR